MQPKKLIPFNEIENFRFEEYKTENISKETIELFNNTCKEYIDELKDYNFEELAFVDYMFGLHSNEVFGHKKSSFSNMLNHLKKTSNYYS